MRMGFRRVNYFIWMKWNKSPWLLYQASHICMCFSCLILLPIALSCGTGVNLGILMVPKYSTTGSSIGVFLGVISFWGCARYLSYRLLLTFKIDESLCPCPAQLALTVPVPPLQRRVCASFLPTESSWVVLGPSMCPHGYSWASLFSLG